MQLKIKDFAQIKYGKESKNLEHGSYPVYGSSGIIRHSNSFLYDKDSVLIPRKGSLNNVFFAKTPFWATDTMFYTIIDEEQVLPIFFYYSMHQIDLAILNSGTGVPSLTAETLNDIPINIPKKDIQFKISNALANLDRKISINNSIISKLEEMAKTIYEYWFLQFDFPNQEGKPYASSGGAMKYSEELGREIPSDWEVRYTNHFCEVQTGSEDANFATPQGKYKFFTCAQESYQCDTPAFEGHAILIAGNGDFNVKHYTGEFNAYQRTYVLLPKKQNYALLYFVVQQRIAHFKKGSNGSIVKFIRKSDVENIPIPYPNDTKILDTLNHFILMKEQKMSENQKLAQLRDWLLPMLMNGQVRIE